MQVAQYLVIGMKTRSTVWTLGPLEKGEPARSGKECWLGTCPLQAPSADLPLLGWELPAAANSQTFKSAPGQPLESTLRGQEADQSHHPCRARTNRRALHTAVPTPVGSGLPGSVPPGNPLLNATSSLSPYSPSRGTSFSFLLLLISGSPHLPPV